MTRASAKLAPEPSWVAKGSISARLPARIAAAKPRMMIWEEDSLRFVFPIRIPPLS